MGNIKNTISSDTVSKIFGNAENGVLFLRELTGENMSKNPAIGVWKKIAKKWEYEKALKIVRKMFKESEKYKNGKKSEQALGVLLKEWKKKDLGSVEWPFGQNPNAFDKFVQSINNEKVSREKKDRKVEEAAVRYRRIKEINTIRNDFIETLIFEKNENILPTLTHKKGVDFFINGTQFDQKVSRGLTKQFKEDYPEQVEDITKTKPNEVARDLYTHQNETRFDWAPRLYVVFLEQDVSAKNIKEIIKETNLNKPLDISFTYTFENGKKKSYKTKCFVILLYKK